jgi:hypothetical protein
MLKNVLKQHGNNLILHPERIVGNPWLRGAEKFAAMKEFLRRGHW